MMAVYAALSLFFITVTAFADDGNDWLQLNGRGNELQRLSRLTEAVECFEKALAIAERVSPPDARVAASLNNLGLAHHESGHPVEAERAYLRSIKTSEQYVGPRSQELMVALTNLSTLYVETQQVGKADALVKRLEELFAITPPSDRQKIRLFSIRGGIYQNHRKWAEAEECYRAAFALAETSPEYTAEAASALNNLSVVAYERHDYKKAKQTLDRAVELTKSHDGPLSPRLISPYVNLATIAFRDKRHSEAVSLLEHVIAILEKSGPMDSTFLRQAYDRYAIALRMAGRKSDAKVAAVRAKSVGQDPVLALRDRHTVNVWSLQDER